MNYTLTQDLLDELKPLSARKRSEVMKVVAQTEWDRCAEDIFYWLDVSRHPLAPYVYTQDPHPLHVCNMCRDGSTHHFNKRSVHLKLAHDLDIDDFQELKGYFTELDTTRIFTVMPYMPPIIKAWLEHQFIFIEKSRDMMATWLTVMMYTWDTLFHKGKQNVFQSETASKTYELVNRANFIYKHQPKFLRDVMKAEFGAGSGRAGVLTVEKLDSEIIGFAQGPDQIRQYHPSGVFQDEAAFQVDAGAAFSAIKPSIQQGGRFTAVSSANPSWFMLCCQDNTDE